jgi:hypothetical protein
MNRKGGAQLLLLARIYSTEAQVWLLCVPKLASRHDPKDTVDGQSQENHAQQEHEQQLFSAEFSQNQVERFNF